MSEDNVFKTVSGIIIEHLGLRDGSVSMESDISGDLGADSLDIIEITMEIEEEFDLEIDNVALEKIRTVGDLVNYIRDGVASLQPRNSGPTKDSDG